MANFSGRAGIDTVTGAGERRTTGARYAMRRSLVAGLTMCFLVMGVGWAQAAPSPTPSPPVTPTPSVSPSPVPSATTSAGTPSSATPSATATASVPVSTPSSPTAEQTPSVSASPTASAPTAARKAEAESAAEKAIRERHARLGGDKGRLGARVGSTICGLRDGGCYQRFRSGSIYWTKKTGADPIWGSIQSRWRELKSEHGRLGYPTDSEKCGLRDGGCYQRFRGGSIYWEPEVGGATGLGFDVLAVEQDEVGTRASGLPDRPDGQSRQVARR
ncbi:hypothetical protein ACF3NT_09515 [Naumannella halotolerans]|uniref:LGFP repeat-containing protein n=1 Tax=Naumannella halotolerans TaxID=993414 RepID=UPI00370D8942